jgi:hypothetical protein
MSAPAYFKDAADYHDWWFFSGTALGAVSPGETFKMLHEQLSEADANTAIAVRFLDENDRGIDPQLWRKAFVFGHVGSQVALTLRALEAIGAVGIVRALRSSPAQPHPSPWPRRWCGPATTTAERSRKSSFLRRAASAERFEGVAHDPRTRSRVVLAFAGCIGST